MEKIWLKHYPSNVPKELPPLEESLVQRFESACTEFAHQEAFISFDRAMSYKELREKSLELAGFLQSQGLEKGDSIVIQLPNVLQQPVCVWASILSGLTVINMNPLYTAREMLGPLKETKAKAIALLPDRLLALKGLIDETDIQLVLLSGPGDLLPFPKRQIINFFFKCRLAVKTGKLPLEGVKKSVSFLKALQKGSGRKAQIREKALREISFIQYTGGVTGTSKGVALSQKNILSNIKQGELWMLSGLERGRERALAPLPLYHSFCFSGEWLCFLFKWL